MEILVEMDWLSRHLSDPNVRIIDCRFVLNEPTIGLNSYMEGHLPNALYFDLEKDLAGEKKEHGGRHPLPDVEELCNKLSAAGIDHTKKVIAYDDQGGPFASRFWWLLHYLGHKDVHVLNGTFTSWKEKGYPVTTEIPSVEESIFKPSIQEQEFMEAKELIAKIQQGDIQLLDSREEKRYLGIEEPIDKIAGHIPGAKHFFWKEGVSADGSWKSPAEQEKRIEAFDKTKETVVYCGSGVTACPNVITLKNAGFTNVRLYMGSWSDWITYPEYPIEKG